MIKRRSAVTFDWILISVFISILLIGWLMLYVSSYDEAGPWFDLSSAVGRQTIWMGISALVFIAVLNLDWRIWNSLSYPLYIIGVLSLVAVLIFGKEIKGASSWFSIFGFTIQPSEFAKAGTALALAAYLGKPGVSLENTKTILAAAAIFFVPAFLILLQPDAGTAIVYMAFLIPMFRAGLNAGLYILGLSLGFIFIGSLIWSPVIMLLIIILASYLFQSLSVAEKRIPLSLLLLLSLFTLSSFNFINYSLLVLILLLSGVYFFALLFKEGKYRELLLSFILIIGSTALSFGTQWAFDSVLKPHQQARINVWLKPHLSDPKGDLYNIIQSKTAIGSGGFTGKGFLNGTMTRLNYVPEQNTDFVFSILGEEQGFLGSISLIVLFTTLLFRISTIAERAAFPYIKYYAYGVAGLLFFHFFINIGMTMGIMPVIGIPLPLLSKGGSALFAFTVMIAILLRMDLGRSRY